MSRADSVCSSHGKHTVNTHVCASRQENLAAEHRNRNKLLRRCGKGGGGRIYINPVRREKRENPDRICNSDFVYRCFRQNIFLGSVSLEIWLAVMSREAYFYFSLCLLLLLRPQFGSSHASPATVLTCASPFPRSEWHSEHAI